MKLSLKLVSLSIPNYFCRTFIPLLLLANLWQPSDAAEQADDVGLTTKQESAITLLQACQMDSEPETLYNSFNTFCQAFFGAEQDNLIYEHCGKQTQFLDAGAWQYISAHSASIATETNLPTISYVEYSTDTSFKEKTTASERHFYLHTHALKGLKENTTYHYRIVAIDERGKRLESQPSSFTTAMPKNAILIPGELGQAPYKLTQKDRIYVLTEDIVCSSSAIEVVADNICLDLNGHSIIYGKGAEKAVTGILVQGTQDSKRRDTNSGFTCYNGSIIQGDSAALAENTLATNFTPFNLKGGDTEIAGLSITYHGPQIWGMRFSNPSGSIHVHHNILLDKGGVIKNRHGAATRSLGFENIEADFQGSLHHNLVKRTRQNGIGGALSMKNNEIYVDSFSTNSFAIQPYSKPGKDAGESAYNRIFGTGFNPYGFGWAHENLNVHNNLIHFQGIDVSKRWHERWGDINMLEGIRVTNYGKGGQVRNNLHYSKNLIILKAGQDCEMRGTGFFSDETISGLEFNDNIVKVIAQDQNTKRAGCVSAHGHTDKPNSLPVWYKNNTFISNITFIRFGDSYAKGHNHYFLNNTFIKVGNNPNFHSFQWGGSYWSYGHQLIDCAFKNARNNDVLINQTGSKSHYFVKWTLDLQCKRKAKVVITNALGETEFEGTTDADGKLSTVLTQCKISPKANNGQELIEQSYTPHTVTISVDDKVIGNSSIEMNSRQALKL